MHHTHKMATKTSGNAGRALSFPIDSFGDCICSKGSSSIGYRVDWCKNHRLQSNQFVGRPEGEEKVTERWRKSRFGQFSCITVAVYFSYFGSVVG